MARGQASMEAIVIISVLMTLFSILMLQVVARDNEVYLRGEKFKKRIVCNEIANEISKVFSSDSFSRISVELPYRYNVSIYGGSGYIEVGNYPNIVSCNMPAGIFNYNLTFDSISFNLTNSNNSVVIDYE